MLKQIFKSFALLSLLSLGACATIVEGSTDNINVSTVPAMNVNCTLNNERGSVSVYTPASITVKRSRSDLHIQCADAVTGSNGTGIVESDVEGWAFGNILWGLSFPIALGVDWFTGAAYDYPDSVSVTMNKGVASYAPSPTIPSNAVQYYAPAAPQATMPSAATAYTPGYVPPPAGVVAPAIQMPKNHAPASTAQPITIVPKQ